MNEPFATPFWADHHDQFSGDITKGIAALWRAFKRVHGRQFEAPWELSSSAKASSRNSQTRSCRP